MIPTHLKFVDIRPLSPSSPSKTDPIDKKKLGKLIKLLDNPSSKLRATLLPTGEWRFTSSDTRQTLQNDPVKFHKQAGDTVESFKALAALRATVICNDQNAEVLAWLDKRTGEISQRSLEALWDISSISQTSPIIPTPPTPPTPRFLVLTPLEEDAKKIVDVLKNFAPMELVLDLILQTFGASSTQYNGFDELQGKLNSEVKKLCPQDPQAAAVFMGYVRQGLLDRLEGSGKAKQNFYTQGVQDPFAWAHAALSVRNAYAAECASEVVKMLMTVSFSPIDDALDMLKYLEGARSNLPALTEHHAIMLREFKSVYPNDGAALNAAIRRKLYEALPSSIVKELQTFKGHANFEANRKLQLAHISDVSDKHSLLMSDSLKAILKAWPDDKTSDVIRVLKLFRLTCGQGTVPGSVSAEYSERSKAFNQQYENQRFDSNLRVALAALLPGLLQPVYLGIRMDVAVAQGKDTPEKTILRWNPTWMGEKAD